MLLRNISLVQDGITNTWVYGSSLAMGGEASNITTRTSLTTPRMKQPST